MLAAEFFRCGAEDKRFSGLCVDYPPDILDVKLRTALDLRPALAVVVSDCAFIANYIKVRVFWGFLNTYPFKRILRYPF